MWFDFQARALWCSGIENQCRDNHRWHRGNWRNEGNQRRQQQESRCPIWSAPDPVKYSKITPNGSCKTRKAQMERCDALKSWWWPQTFWWLRLLWLARAQYDLWRSRTICTSLARYASIYIGRKPLWLAGFVDRPPGWEPTQVRQCAAALQCPLWMPSLWWIRRSKSIELLQWWLQWWWIFTLHGTSWNWVYLYAWSFRWWCGFWWNEHNTRIKFAVSTCHKCCCDTKHESRQDDNQNDCTRQKCTNH